MKHNVVQNKAEVSELVNQKKELVQKNKKKLNSSDFFKNQFNSKVDLNSFQKKFYFDFFQEVNSYYDINSEHYNPEIIFSKVDNWLHNLLEINKELKAKFSYQFKIRAFLDIDYGIGFASPFEIKKYLGIPYNILNYHLRILKGEGKIKQISVNNNDVLERIDMWVLIHNKSKSPPRDFYKNVKDNEFSNQISFFGDYINSEFKCVREEYAFNLKQLPKIRKQKALELKDKNTNDYSRILNYFNDAKNVLELIKDNNGNWKFEPNDLAEYFIFDNKIVITASLNKVKTILKRISKRYPNLIERGQGHHMLIYFEKSKHYKFLKKYWSPVNVSKENATREANNVLMNMEEKL